MAFEWRIFTILMFESLRTFIICQWNALQWKFYKLHSSTERLCIDLNHVRHILLLLCCFDEKRQRPMNGLLYGIESNIGVMNLFICIFLGQCNFKEFLIGIRSIRRFNYVISGVFECETDLFVKGNFGGCSCSFGIALKH